MMAVIRVHKTTDYTVMSNAHFRETKMSFKAKGILSQMLSLPDEWDYSIAGLVTLSTDGKDSVMSGLDELEALGYLVRTRVFDGKGRFAGYDYDIYENPNTENPKSGKPYAENPNTENPQQLNTYKSIPKKSSTDKSNTERKKDASYDALISDLCLNSNVEETVREFIKMRKLIKKPLTDYALKRLLNKLNGLSSDPETQVQILEKSIVNNWQDIYELKETATPRRNKSDGSEYADLC